MHFDPSGESTNEKHPSSPQASDGFAEAPTVITDPSRDPAIDSLLEALLDDQQQHWQKCDPISAEEYFRRHPALGSDEEAAAVLVYGEFLLQQQAGKALSFENYLKQFSRYACQLQRLYEADHLFEQPSPQPFPPATNDLIEREMQLGDYDLLEEVGRGGMGIVYRAQQRSLDRVVAIKMLLAERFAGSVDVERFLNEAKAAAQLQHPNIVRIYEIGEHQGRHFFAMDLVEGASLARLIQQNPLTAVQAATYLRTIAEAVQHAHEHGILHRDLKPANILIDAAGQVRITDFGLAKRMQSDCKITLTGQLLGTPSYMPPEQASGKHDALSPASDVYALGAILYELLTGRPPFRAATPVDTLRQVLDHEPVRPRLLNPQTPRDLETICLKCLRKEPAQRYGSAKELAADLGRFLEGKPIWARPVGLVERWSKWLRRHPTAAALVIALVVCPPLLLFLAGRTVLQDQRLRAEQEIAIAHRYHHLVSKTGEGILNPQVGWTFQGLKDIDEAARLPTTVRDAVQLRTLAARCLGGVDLREVAVLAKGMQAFCCVFSPDGKQLAIAQELGLFKTSVQVFDVERRKLLRELIFPAHAVDIRQTGVRSLVYSADSRWLAAGVRNGEVHVWDALNDFEHRSLSSAHSDEVTGLAFQPDGRILLSASKDKTLKVWDCSTWSEKAHHTFDRNLTAAYFSPNGAYFVWGSQDQLHAIEAKYLPALPDPSRIRTPSEFSHPKVAFAPHGSPWFVIRDGRPGVTLFPLNPGNFFQLSPGADLDHDNVVTNLEVGACGTLLVTSSGDRSVKLAEVGSGRRLANLVVGGRGNLHGALRLDGRYLAVTADHQTLLYEVTGQREETLVGCDALAVQCMAFAPDGQKLAYLTGHPRGDTRLNVWSLAGPSQQWCNWTIAPFSPETGLRTPAIAFHPGGVLLASAPAYEKDVIVWDGRERRQLLPQPAWLANFPCFSRDGQTMWGATRQTNEVISLKWPELTVRTTWSNTQAGNRGLICLAAGERWILAGSRDLSTKLLRVSDGQLERSWPSPSGPIHSVALSADETLAASGTQTGHVQVVRLPGGETFQQWQPHRDAVDAVAFHPDGQLLATGSKDRTVRLWKRDGDQFHELLALHFGNGVRQVCFSPDGTRLSVLVHNERTVRLWHLDRLRQRLESMGLGWE